MKTRPEEIVSILREEISGYDNRVRQAETGTILEVGDGIATVYGLDKAVYGELVELDTGVEGMVMNLSRDSVGVVLLGSEEGVHEGTVVKRTGRAASVPVGDALIGRVVNALGQPIDGLGPIQQLPRPALSSGRPAVWLPVSRSVSLFRLAFWPSTPWFLSAVASAN